MLKKTSPSLGILASGSGSNMGAIATAINNLELDAEIMVVIYNNPEAMVRERAAKLGIPAVLINHRDYNSREDLDRAIIQILQKYQVNLVIMAGWMRVVTQVLIDAFGDRILNIHPSLLPSFRGTHAIQQALDYGVKIAGCTVHIVSLEVDSGKILEQAAVAVLEDDTVSSLQQRIQKQEHVIYPKAIASFIRHVDINS
jgi:phosphoribosylglycinamide formyltransferase 1